MGAQLLNILVPPGKHVTVHVPVSLDTSDRKEQDGVMDRDVIARQSQAALAALAVEDPDAVVTLGGECSVSVPPFAWLASKYPDDVAMIWMDAHPDICLPYDAYRGYHAMAVTALMGMGDVKLTEMLPGTINASRVLIVGLRSWGKGMQERQKELGIKGLSAMEVAKDSSAILNWLKGTGASKVVVHFDLDVLDPEDMFAGVGMAPDGMKVDEALRVLNDIAAAADLVGLTVAEPMPRLAIRLKNMLAQMPLLKQN